MNKLHALFPVITAHFKDQMGGGRQGSRTNQSLRPVQPDFGPNYCLGGWEGWQQDCQKKTR